MLYRELRLIFGVIDRAYSEILRISVDINEDNFLKEDFAYELFESLKRIIRQNLEKQEE